MTMDPEAISAVAREAILLTLILSAPLVGAAAVVGLLLGLLQALTQLQDQTTAFAVKLLVVMGLMLVLMPWLGAMAFGYAERTFTMIFELR
ncbi:MAG: type III secretion system export apparatus subunit SctS [Pseudomonadota bacterium]|jgi:type III secretion HrpO family protein|nr:type III secretion system export apparatus subunit SctS [Rubrivivax sp.]